MSEQTLKQRFDDNYKIGARYGVPINKTDLLLFFKASGIDPDQATRIGSLEDALNDSFSGLNTTTGYVDEDGFVHTSKYVLGLLVENKIIESGSGTEEDPIKVCSAKQLYDVRDKLDCYFIQVADIDLTTYSLVSGWSAIGTENEPFIGHYDGGGFKISNMTINTAGASVNGLFGFTAGATIENVIIQNAVIHNAQAGLGQGGSVGALIGGNADSSMISNCHVINATLSGAGQFGGFIYGLSNGCVVEDCSINATCSILYTGFGGFISTAVDSIIRRCWANINATYVGNPNPADNYGAFAYTLLGSTIENSYAKGNLIGKDIVCGFAELLDLGTDMATTCTITNCYAAVILTAQTNKRGFDHENTEATITSVYYDSTLAGTTSSVHGTAKTSVQMKTLVTYAGWDFTNTWISPDGDHYPTLITNPEE